MTGTPKQMVGSREILTLSSILLNEFITLAYNATAVKNKPKSKCFQLKPNTQDFNEF